MGLYTIICLKCEAPFFWHTSGPQVCERCNMPTKEEILVEVIDFLLERVPDNSSDEHIDMELHELRMRWEAFKK